MAPLNSLEYFRIPPRWLAVKITDTDGNVGWGEATLEGHSQAVEGTLDQLRDRYMGWEADNIEHIWQSVWRHGQSNSLHQKIFINASSANVYYPLLHQDLYQQSLRQCAYPIAILAKQPRQSLSSKYYVQYLSS